MAIGVVGRKCGMTRVFTEDGNSIPVTVIEVTQNRVSQVKTAQTDGYDAVQVTVGARRASRVTAAQAGHFAKAGVEAGRTVREFIISVLLIPSFACVFWMTVFGGTAIKQVVVDGYQQVVEAELPLQLFSMLDALPLSSITSFIAIVLVIVFFVTSSDSGSLVIDVISAGGKVDAPTPQRVFWCIFEGLVAISLIVGGGLVALQAMAVSTGLPFTLVLLVAAFSTVKGLMSEPR